MNIPLLVFMSEIKIDLTLKKSNFLFLSCVKIVLMQFIPICQPSGCFASNLMLPACVLVMILVVTLVCN